MRSSLLAPPQRLVVAVVAVAYRSLPEARVSGRDVQVTLLAAEIAQVGAFVARARDRLSTPAVDHGQPVSAVAKRDGDVDVAQRILDRATVARHGRYLPVAEAHTLDGVVLARRIKSGRSPASSERSATAERLADCTELNVATASTSVPPAVAREEIVTQSAICLDANRPADSNCRPKRTNTSDCEASGGRTPRARSSR
jgi:hypothetical protein